MPVDTLELRLESSATGAVKALDQLVSRLNAIDGSLTNLNSGGLNRLSLGVRNLSTAMKVMSSVKVRDFSSMANGLNRLAEVDKGNLQAAAGNINRIANSLNNLGSIRVPSNTITTMVTDLKALSYVRTEKAIATLPVLGTALQDFFTKVASSPAISNNIISMTNALARLMGSASGSAGAIRSLSSATRTLSKDTNVQTTAQTRLNNTFRRGQVFAGGFTGQIMKMVGTIFTAKYLIGGLMRSVRSSMDFGETINLFQTAFRKIGMDSGDAFEFAFLERAQNFNDRFTQMLTLDPDEIMNYQARFGAMSNSMGVVGETAFNISSAFTTLGADIASLFNIDIHSAMQKLQSGLAGQIRPLRDIGVDISKTSIAQTALNYGITESIEKMSAATKVQLRFLTTMSQMRIAMGDMARTINEPANQLRVLQQQWKLMARAFGNIFLPVVARVLPYLNAVLIAIRRIMNLIAGAFGYKLPEFKTTPIYGADIPDPMEGLDDDPFEPISSGAGGATEKVKELKKALAGFDELNILNLSDSPSSGGGGGSGGSGGYGLGSGAGYGVLDDAIADEWFNYQTLLDDIMSDMENKASGMADKIFKSLEPYFPFFTGMWEMVKGAWEGVKKTWDKTIGPVIKAIGNWMKENPEATKQIGEWVGGLLVLKTTLGGIKWLSHISGLTGLFNILFGKGAFGGSVVGGKGVLGGIGLLIKEIGFLSTLGILGVLGAGIAGGIYASKTPKTYEGQNPVPSMVGHEARQAANAFVNDSSIGSVTPTERYYEQINARKELEKTHADTSQKIRQYNLMEVGGVEYATKSHANYNIGVRDSQMGATSWVNRSTKEILANFDGTKRGLISTGTEYQTLDNKVKSAMGGVNSNIMGANVSNWQNHLTEWLPGVAQKTDTTMTNVSKGIADKLNEGTTRGLGALGTFKTSSLELMDSLPNPLGTSAGRSGKAIEDGIGGGVKRTVTGVKTFGQDIHRALVDSEGNIVLSSNRAGSAINKGYATGMTNTQSNTSIWRSNMLGAFGWLGTEVDRVISGSSKVWSGKFTENMTILYNNLLSFARMIGVTLPYRWYPAYSQTSATYRPGQASGFSNRAVIEGFATGGQPQVGQLFYAREGGIPELVGNMGGRTTVMNNDQIVSAVAQGVASAVASVMGGGTNQPIVVQVGSDTIVDTVVRGITRANRASGQPILIG